MALRELSDIQPEAAGGATGGEEDALLDQLLNYDKGEGDTTPDAAATPEATQEETYIVQEGDTLNKISQDLGIPLKDLAEQNQITDVNVITPGQEIKYTKPGAAPAEEGMQIGGETITMQEGGTTEEGVLGAKPEPAPGDMVTSTEIGDEAKVDFEAKPVEEPKIDAAPVDEKTEVVLEEPGDAPDLEEQSKQSAIQVAKNVGTGLSPDTKEVYDDVINKIDEMDITPTEGVEEYYNRLAESINNQILKYDTKISEIAEEKRKPTFEGWNKFLAVLGAAMGAYGSAMTGTPNYAQKILDNAIDRDIQEFAKSKEIRTKALSDQRMELIMRRGELLQLAQNRVNQLMQSKTFKLAQEEAKANITALFEGIEQRKQENFMDFKMRVAELAATFYASDASLRSSLNKDQRKRMVNSFTAVDSKGNAVAVPAYLARDVDSAKKLTTEQSAAMDALGYLEEIDQLYESNEKYIPAWLGGTVAQKIDRIANKLELTFKKIEGMGANYTQYEAALIRGILPTSDIMDKITKHKVKSAMLRDQLINKIKNNARVRGAALEDPMPTTNNNIENFGGAKGVSG